MRAVSAARQNLLLFYQAALNGAAGHQVLLAQDMSRIIKNDGGNAYYRWFGEGLK